MKIVTYSFEHYPQDSELIEEQIVIKNPSYLPIVGEGVSFTEKYIWDKLDKDAANNISSFDWIVAERFYIPDEDRIFITLKCKVS